MISKLVSEGSDKTRLKRPGVYQAVFLGVSEKERPTFQTKDDPEPEYEECFVFEWGVQTSEGEAVVSKWVRVPPRLSAPGKNGKASNLYKVLCWLYGKSTLTTDDLKKADDVIAEAVGKPFQIVVEIKPSGWAEIVTAIPQETQAEEEDLPF